MARSYRLGELAGRLQGAVRGDPERRVRGIATLDQAGPDEISFLTHPRYRRRAADSRAGAIVVGPDSGLAGRDLLEVADPYLAVARLLQWFHPPPPRRTGISPLAWVAQGVELAEEVAIGPFAVIEEGPRLEAGVSVGAGCVVGRDCRVGRESELMPRVVLYPGTQVGPRCLIHSGVVLGADGFGFATSAGRHHKIPQVGRVVIEADVEIGANSAVDRATLGETCVGEGSKIDDLVMIAHGVRIGPGALLAAQSGISGSSRVGARATFAGQSGAAGHLELGEGVVVAAKSAVLRDLPAGAFVAGIPAVNHLQWKRSQALVQKLPGLRREIRLLERRLSRLEDRLAGHEP
jgi:UDP-3-O-[3-hydroxymyristoyl] glucosamine N-acyltransferase